MAKQKNVSFPYKILKFFNFFFYTYILKKTLKYKKISIWVLECMTPKMDEFKFLFCICKHQGKNLFALGRGGK